MTESSPVYKAKKEINKYCDVGTVCNVWNDHFKFCKTKRVVKYLQHPVWRYIDEDGGIWKNAEPI